MDIQLQNNGVFIPVTVPDGADAGHIRTLRDPLQRIGVPSSYTLAVNNVGVDDNTVLQPGDVVTFRPKDGDKGSEPEAAAA